MAPFAGFAACAVMLVVVAALAGVGSCTGDSAPLQVTYEAGEYLPVVLHELTSASTLLSVAPNGHTPLSSGLRTTGHSTPREFQGFGASLAVALTGESATQAGWGVSLRAGTDIKCAKLPSSIAAGKAVRLSSSICDSGYAGGLSVDGLRATASVTGSAASARALPLCGASSTKDGFSKHLFLRLAMVSSDNGATMSLLNVTAGFRSKAEAEQLCKTTDNIFTFAASFDIVHASAEHTAALMARRWSGFLAVGRAPALNAFRPFVMLAAQLAIVGVAATALVVVVVKRAAARIMLRLKDGYNAHQAVAPPPRNIATIVSVVAAGVIDSHYAVRQVPRFGLAFAALAVHGLQALIVAVALAAALAAGSATPALPFTVLRPVLMTTVATAPAVGVIMASLESWLKLRRQRGLGPMPCLALLVLPTVAASLLHVLLLVVGGIFLDASWASWEAFGYNLVLTTACVAGFSTGFWCGRAETCSVRRVLDRFIFNRVPLLEVTPPLARLARYAGSPHEARTVAQLSRYDVPLPDDDEDDRPLRIPQPPLDTVAFVAMGALGGATGVVTGAAMSLLTDPFVNTAVALPPGSVMFEAVGGLLGLGCAAAIVNIAVLSRGATQWWWNAAAAGGASGVVAGLVVLGCWVVQDRPASVSIVGCLLAAIGSALVAAWVALIAAFVCSLASGLAFVGLFRGLQPFQIDIVAPWEEDL